MSQTWMFLNHKKCHSGFFMFCTCTINIITYVYPFTQQFVFVKPQKCPNSFLSVLSIINVNLYVCPFTHKKLFIINRMHFLKNKIWLHCNETLNVTILTYVMNMTFIEMWHDLFFHCDENLNVTILINVMTQNFQFNSRDMRF